MFVTIISVSVKKQHVDAFIEAARVNHESSIQEEGNLRFDVLQSPDDPAKFVLYEAYASQQYAIAHKDTRHYSVWREKVADWMAKPREGSVFNGLFPSNNSSV